MDKPTFKFALGQVVVLATSVPALRTTGRPDGCEAGTIIGRAEYPDSPNAYYVRYRAGDRRQVEVWWNEDALVDPDAMSNTDDSGKGQAETA